MTTRYFIIGILVLCVSGLAGTVFGQGTEQAPDATTTGNETPDNPVTDALDPVYFDSFDGDFEVRFPGGCSRVRERIPKENAEIEAAGYLRMTVHASCDRQGYMGEGCSVTAFVDPDLGSGPPADEAFVIERIEMILKQYGVTIQEQRPYHAEPEDGPVVDGLDVLATDPDKKGQVWVRGMLIEGDVYILVAWRTMGQLAYSKDYIEFFDSFKAHSSS